MAMAPKSRHYDHPEHRADYEPAGYSQEGWDRVFGPEQDGPQDDDPFACGREEASRGMFADGLAQSGGRAEVAAPTLGVAPGRDHAG